MDSSNSKSEYTIRLMTDSDVEEALRVFASHGYCESPSAVRVFMECDPNAFYVAVSNDDHKIIGVCASPVTSHSTAYFGVYAVLSGYQGKGVGMKLFNACLQHIADRNSGLFAARDMEQKYGKIGFRVKGLKMIVYEGEPQNIESLNETIDKNLTIKRFDDNRELLEKILLYDTKVHNDNREKLMTLTLLNSNYYTLIALDSDHNILGFGCVKTDINDCKMIGPVYADNDTIAEALIIRLIIEYKSSKSNSLYLFAPNTSIGCIKLCDKLQLKEEQSCNELYTKFIPKINSQFIYCIHSPDFAL